MGIKLSVFMKGLILITVPLLLQLAFFGLLANMQRSNAEAVARSIHSKEVLQQTQLVLRDLLEVGAGLRGSILAADPDLAAAYERAAKQIPQDIIELHKRVSDNPMRAAQIERIGSATDEFLAWHAETVRLSMAGQRNQAIARAKSPRSARLQNAIQKAVMDFISIEERLDEAGTLSLAQSQNRQRWLLLAGSGLSFVITLCLAFVFSRDISGRLTAVMDNVQRLRKAEKLAPPMAGRDEIAELDQSFQDLAAELYSSQAALRGQNRVLGSVLNSIAEGVIVADEQGSFVLFNPAAKRILGMGATATQPEDWPQVYGTFYPDGTTPLPAEELPLVRAIRGEETDHVEILIRNPQAPAGVSISITGRPLRDEQGTARGGVVVFRDITDQKRAEEALRETNERLRLLAENATDYALLMLDTDGRVRTWNIGAERIKGYRAEEIIGKHFSCFYPDEAVARGWPGEELRIADAEGRLEDEGWRVRKDGSRFWANVILTALRDKSGRLCGFSKLTRDLTERKRAEEAVRRLNQDLEQRVLERTAELAAVNKDLSLKNQENEMFVYSVSHDLRSPLVNLQGFSKELNFSCQELRVLLMADDVPASVRTRGLSVLDADVAESLRFIQSAVMRLSHIIDALLRLSRAGRVEYQLQEVDVNCVVRRVVESLTKTIDERAASVQVDDLPPAWGDPAAVEQIFANLIGNALNYLERARPGLIEVGCKNGCALEGDGFRTYFVRDNGVGIAEAYQQKVFQAFQRFHPHLGPGEGMGLAIVRRVVERHNGSVRLESRPGEGSTFLVTLPANRRNGQPALHVGGKCDEK